MTRASRLGGGDCSAQAGDTDTTPALPPAARYRGNMKEDVLALWKIWMPSTILNFAFMPMWGCVALHRLAAVVSTLLRSTQTNVAALLSPSRTPVRAKQQLQVPDPPPPRLRARVSLGWCSRIPWVASTSLIWTMILSTMRGKSETAALAQTDGEIIAPGTYGRT